MANEENLAQNEQQATKPAWWLLDATLAAVRV